MEDMGPSAFGVVVERGRGSLPFALLHGEPLVACAAWAMGEAGVQLLDLTTSWEAVRDTELPLVWHDALCPGTPPELIAACVRRAAQDDVRHQIRGLSRVLGVGARHRRDLLYRRGGLFERRRLLDGALRQ